MTENQDNSVSKRSTFFPLLLFSCLALGFVGGFGLKNFIPNYVSNQSNFQKSDASSSVDEIMRFIQARYVDKLTYEELTDKTIHGILTQLDPHSTYITPQELKAVNEDMGGDFEGVGIEFLLLRDTINVVSTVYGGPSEKVGILPGDQIISVNDVNVAGKKIDNMDVTKYLKGKKGSKVTVFIKRAKKTTLIPFTIVRDEIPLNSIDAAFSINDKTAFIKINRFSNKTYQEFMGAIDSLFIKGKKENLILDLRQNPGGYLQEATNILSQLIPDRNKLLVYTKGRNFKKTDYETNGRSYLHLNKLAILIDEGSASASEILAGAIQDWDKGVLIGRRSFGKGLVQEQYDLQNGGALRLTVAKYYTPSGRCIQKNFDHYNDEIETRLENGELTGKQKSTPKDTTKYFTSRGRVVYASGGITPDIFVPVDTNLLNPDNYSMRQFASEFALEEVKNNRSAYPNTLGSFMSNKNLEQQVLERFTSFYLKNAKKSSVIIKPAAKKALSKYISARIARQLFGPIAYFKVEINDDDAVNRALQQFTAPKLIPQDK